MCACTYHAHLADIRTASTLQYVRVVHIKTTQLHQCVILISLCCPCSHPPPSQISSEVRVPFYPPKDVPLEMHIKALVGYSDRWRKQEGGTSMSYLHTVNTVRLHDARAVQIPRKEPTWVCYRATYILYLVMCGISGTTVASWCHVTWVVMGYARYGHTQVWYGIASACL